MEAFEDSTVKGVIAATSGDKEIRVLTDLDPTKLRENPTRFYGLSDNPCLITYFWMLGISSFYQGVVLNDLQPADEIS